MSHIEIGAFNITPKDDGLYPSGMSVSLSHDGFGLDTGNDSIFEGYADDCIQTSVDYDESITANDTITVKFNNIGSIYYYGARVIMNDGSIHKEYLQVTRNNSTITLTPTSALVALSNSEQKNIVAIIVNAGASRNSNGSADRAINITTKNCFTSYVLPNCRGLYTPDVYVFPLSDCTYKSITASVGDTKITPVLDNGIYKIPSTSSSTVKYSNPVTITAEYTSEAPATQYTVTYTDGVDGSVFDDQSYTVDEGSETPAFDGTPTRDGYNFTGWKPTVAETVTEDVTYTAQWEEVQAVTYTVKYEDGVNGTAFTSQTFTVNEGSNTPAFNGTPTRSGYKFTGWTPTVAETVTADATYTAQWEEDEQPTPPAKKSRLFPLTNTYKLTYEQLQEISEGTWLKDTQQGTTVSPTDYTTSLKKVFCDVPTTETDIFRFATWTDKSITCDVVTENIVTLKCGSKEITEKYNSVADYSNTTIEIYLPFDGIETLDTEKVMNKTITIVYHVDCITGDSVITITDEDDTLLYTFSCNISQDFPYMNEMLNGGSFNFQSGVPVSLNLTPYIIVRRTKSSGLDNNNTNNKRDLIGNFTGYNQFTDFNVRTKATLKEQAEIIQLLQGGILL